MKIISIEKYNADKHKSYIGTFPFRLQGHKHLLCGS